MPPVGLSVEEPEENRDTRQATGVELIAMERQEQISKHGYHSAHDWGHHHGELRLVAAILATNGTNSKVVSDYGGDFQSGLNVWGLENKLTGDQNKIHRLQVAGALIAAEIDRLQAIENAASEQVEVFYIGEDEFSRKCYKAKDGRIYADVEGDGILYSTTSEGEPIEPVNNVKIIG
jgi:hypothetical protein